MLGNGDHHTAPGAHGGSEGAECTAVVRDVLEDVERSDDVELAVEREICCVELKQSCARNPAARDPQALRMHVAARETVRWKGGGRSGEREAGAAADVEERGSVREVGRERPGEDPATAAKPETRRLEPRELLVHVGVVAAGVGCSS